MLKEWRWSLHGKKVGLAEPLELRLNSAMVLRIVDETDINVIFRGVPVSVGNEGLRVPTEINLTDHPTLVQRFVAESKHAGGGAALEQVHKFGWSLPRISASGRESWETAAAVRPELAPVVRDSDGMRDRVKGDAMKSSITRRMEETHAAVGRAQAGLASTAPAGAVDGATDREDAAGAAPSGSPSRPVTSGTTRGRGARKGAYKDVPSVYAHTTKWRRAKAPPRPCAEIRPKQLDRVVEDADRGELLFVCCVIKTLGRCKAAMAVFADICEAWRREAADAAEAARVDAEKRRKAEAAKAAQEAANAGAKGGKGGKGGKGAKGGKGGKGAKTAKEAPPEPEPVSTEAPEDDAGAAAAAAGGERRKSTVDPLEEDFGRPMRLLVCDCSGSDALSRRFNFSTYPIFFAFHSGKLVWASTAVKGRAATKETVLEQLDECREAALRRRYLPDDYKFTNSRQVSLMALNARHRARELPEDEQRSVVHARTAPVRIGGI